MFKSVTDAENSYLSIEGYDDDLTTKYVYDDAVPNHKKVSEGDWAVIVNKENILGFSRIEKIETKSAKKTRRRCPICGSTNYTDRKTRTPRYRCNNGDEFEELNSEVVDIVKYVAYYGESFIYPRKEFPVNGLRPYFVNNYNRNNSIQLLDFNFFNNYFTSIPRQLRSGLKLYLLPIEAKSVNDAPNYEPRDEDERATISRQIKERRGQKKFRDALRILYGNACMVTDCKILDVLEAAHIKPYRGEKDNHASNGLLLRTDIHTLYDLDLIGINNETLVINVHQSIRRDGYEMYDGLLLKGCKVHKPSGEALSLRWRQFIERN